MHATTSIKQKAAFLLTVFALNTVVGFACSLGADMGFNAPNHDKSAKGSVHIHKEGNIHVHKPAGDKEHQPDKKATSKKDDCCKGKVVKLQTADKNLQYAKATLSAPVFILANAYTNQVLLRSAQPDFCKYIACHFHPPPRDIRIDIQSFQI